MKVTLKFDLILKYIERFSILEKNVDEVFLFIITQLSDSLDATEQNEKLINNYKKTYGKQKDLWHEQFMERSFPDEG